MSPWKMTVHMEIEVTVKRGHYTFDEIVEAIQIATNGNTNKGGIEIRMNPDDTIVEDENTTLPIWKRVGK